VIKAAVDLLVSPFHPEVGKAFALLGVAQEV
jgi:hypothetical protein